LAVAFGAAGAECQRLPRHLRTRPLRPTAAGPRRFAAPCSPYRS